MISVIIPVYNVDVSLLKRCIDSITNNVKSRIEIIVVDDGSEAEFREQYKQYSDRNIQIIIKENGGVSSARNSGIECAQGDWVLFVDADDWLEAGSIDRLNTMCESSDADLFFFSHTREYWKRSTVFACNTYESQDEITEEVEKLQLMKKTIAASEYREAGARATCFRAVWGALFRRQMLMEYNIRFREGMAIGEDMIFRLWCEYYSQKTVYADYPFYHYVIYSDSASTVYRKTGVQDAQRELEEISAFMKLTGLEYELEEAFRFRIIEVMTVLPKRTFFHKKNPLSYTQRRNEAECFYNSALVREYVGPKEIKMLPLKRKIQIQLLLRSRFRTYMAIIKLSDYLMGSAKQKR